jgi:hypothetical protein
VVVRRPVVASVVRLLVVRLLVVVSVVRLLVVRPVVVSVVRLLVVRLLVVVSAVLRRINLVVVAFNNNRWEWEELQCKVVRVWVRVWRRVECNRTVVRLVAAR